MQKIHITSNCPIELPQCLKNIDLSLGISYFSTNDQEIKTIKDAWGFKTLSKIFNIANKLTSYRFSNQEIVNQILTDSNFVAQYYSENASNLHVQINHYNLVAKTFNYLAKLDVLKKITFKIKGKNTISLSTLDEVFFGTRSDSTHIYLKDKQIFLGTRFFDGNNILSYLTKKQAISFIFFHEYSHASEIENSTKYGRKIIKTNTSFDNFYHNLFLLYDSKKFSAFSQEVFINDKISSLPSKLLINTLYVLYNEMYADVNALLLIRNKDIINGEYNEEKNFIQSILKMRNDSKNQYPLFCSLNNDSIFNKQSHFTSPGLESLLNHLKSIPSRQVLSEQQMHELTYQCVQEGIGKTLLTMIKINNSLIPQFRTLFSVQLEQDNLIIDTSKNYYLACIKTIKQIVSPEWQNNFENNLKLIDQYQLEKHINISQDLIFDAGLDHQSFNNKLQNYIQKEKSFNKITNTLCVLRDKFLKTQQSSNHVFKK